jgi:hypothetical protein
MIRERRYYATSADEQAEIVRDEARRIAREDAFEAQIEAMINAVHPALRGIARHLLNEQDDISEAACVAFALEQVAKIGKKARETDKSELRSIYRDVQARGGAAYGEHKARLQQLNTK